MKRFWDKVNKKGPDECWNWTAYKDECGYGCFIFLGRRERSHRVVLMLEGIDIPSGMLVCHHCDNPSCVNPDHLFIGSQLDNMKDMQRKNRGIAGEKNGRSKLIDQDVFRIFDLLKCGAKQIHIAKYFNIDTAQISSINTGKAWKHLRGNYIA